MNDDGSHVADQKFSLLSFIRSGDAIREIIFRWRIKLELLKPIQSVP